MLNLIAMPAAPQSLLAGVPRIRTPDDAGPVQEQLFSIRLGMAVTVRPQKYGVWIVVCPHCDGEIELVDLDVATALHVEDGKDPAPTFDANPGAFIKTWLCAFWRVSDLARFRRVAEATAAMASVTGRIRNDRTVLSALALNGGMRSVSAMYVIVNKLIGAGLMVSGDESWVLTVPPPQCSA